MKLRELWRLSSTVFKELSFQSIYSLRAGSALPRRGRGDINQLVRTASYNTLISKLLTTLFVAVFAFTVFFPLMYPYSLGPSTPPKELALAGSMSAFLASVLFLIVFMGLQISTSMVSSKIAEILSPLPITKKDVSNVIFICFLRVFDLPLVASVVVLLAAYALIGGSIAGGLVSLIAVVTTEAFALALTIGLARFFYSRVSSGGGRSRWKTLLRLVSMFIWILPTFGMYLLVSFASDVVRIFADLALSFSAYTQLLALIFPFSFGFLVSLATFTQQVNVYTLVFSGIASLAYLLLAVRSTRWVTDMIRRLGAPGLTSTIREVVKDTIIKPQTAWLGIIRKDLRVASRSPSFASLFLLPAIQTVILALSFSSFTEAGFSVALGILTGVSALTLLLPPTMFSIEGLASAYTRSLPLKKQTLVFAKTALSTSTYLISLAILLVVATLMGRDFTYVMAFGLIHALSVASGSMLELTILANKFWKEGFALGNLYARLSTFILILLPGLLLAVAPLIAAFITYIFAMELVLPVFFLAAFVEFAIMCFIAFRRS